MIKTLRVGHVFGLFHIGNMPDEKTRHSTKLFAERVMPSAARPLARVEGRPALVDQAVREARAAGAERGRTMKASGVMKDGRSRPAAGSSSACAKPARARRSCSCTAPAASRPRSRCSTQLAERFHVFAPLWPGFGEEPGEELLEDMLDFTLHGLDVVEALGLERPHLVGHSMGGMIAAEMACVANAALRQARAARARRPLARRAPDPRPVRDAALGAAGPALRRPEGGREAAARRPRLQQRRRAHALHGRQRAPPRQRRQDPVPDPEPPPQQAPLSAARRDAAGLGPARTSSSRPSTPSAGSSSSRARSSV